MAFYIVVKGKITNFDFKYLENPDLPRLPKTIISKNAKGIPQEKLTTNNKDVFAIEIMSKKLIKLSPANTTAQAKDLMQEKAIHHIPILVDGILTGIISDTDLSNAADDARLHKIMTQTILCASESTNLSHIVKVFYQENIRCLPIVDDQMFVVGLVTNRDIMKWIIDNKMFYKI